MTRWSRQPGGAHPCRLPGALRIRLRGARSGNRWRCRRCTQEYVLGFRAPDPRHDPFPVWRRAEEAP